MIVYYENSIQIYFILRNKQNRIEKNFRKDFNANTDIFSLSHEI